MQIRPLDPSRDRTAVTAFVADHQAATGHPGLSESKVATLAEPGDRPGGGMVAEEAGEMVGCAVVAPASMSGEWGLEVVAGTRGVIERLAHAALDRIESEGGTRLRWWTYHPEMQAIPPRLGFRPERELWMMARPLPTDDRPDFAPGFEVRGFIPGRDEVAWIRANNAAFAGHPENGDLDIGDLKRRMETEWFDPEGVRMAWAGEDLAGFCWTKRHGREEGEIYIIGTVPEYQRRGLGRALVLEGMRYLADQGCRRVFLYTEGDNDKATRLYRDLGFEVELVHRSFVREPG